MNVDLILKNQINDFLGKQNSRVVVVLYLETRFTTDFGHIARTSIWRKLENTLYL